MAWEPTVGRYRPSYRATDKSSRPAVILDSHDHAEEARKHIDDLAQKKLRMCSKLFDAISQISPVKRMRKEKLEYEKQRNAAYDKRAEVKHTIHMNTMAAAFRKKVV
jgi:hypothetical protein